MSQLGPLFESNRLWAKRMTDQDPEFFSTLSRQQTPEFLWIGCSDSRVPANQIVDLLPGQVFVHRNVANVVVHTDLNCLSVIQFAVDVLQVKHVIVCGHYGCGGVLAAERDDRLGLIDNWLRHVQDVRDLHQDRLASCLPAQKSKLLCELNVIEQAVHVCETTIVQDAWRRRQDLTVHGWIYALDDGHLRDLEVSVSGPGQLRSARLGALRRMDGRSPL